MKQKVKNFLKFRSKNSSQTDGNDTSGSDLQCVANNFKHLTTILNDSQSIEECISFYNEKILLMYPINDEQLPLFFQTYDLIPNVTKLFEVYIPFFELSIQDDSKWANGFMFLQSAITYTNPNDSIKQNLYDFIFTILNSDNRSLLEISKEFFISFLNNPFFSEDALKGQNLIRIWKSVFMSNINASQVLGDSFINILPNINYSGIDDIQPFLENVLLTLNKDMTNSLNLLPKSLEFISKIMGIIDTGSFIESLIDSIRSYLVNIPDLFFLKYLLTAKSNKLGIVWEVINHLFANPSTSMAKIKMLIDIFKSVKDISKLKASSLLTKFDSISKEDLQTLLNIIKLQSNEFKFAFICNACPPWLKHVSPDFFEQVLTSGTFDGGQIQTIFDIYIKSEESFYEYVHITQVKRSVYFLLSHMTSDMEIASELLNAFLTQLNKKTLKSEAEEALTDIVDKIFITGNHQFLTTAVVNFFEKVSNSDDKNIEDRVFSILAVELLNYDDVAILLRKKNVCSFIEKYLDKISCVDFLASLANDGPCDEIDEFINKIDFESSPLSRLDNKSLTNLMLGLPHDSSYDGLVRITSLCKYIEEVPIKTPFDRYMIANKLKKMNKKTFYKCSSFYIRSNKILLDSSYLREISDPDFFHFSVYQSHYSMRHSYATFPSAVTTSIWIYFEKLINETIVLSSPCFRVIVSLEEIRVNSNEPHQFSLMEWHLLTVHRNNPTFGTKLIEIFLDDKKIADIECKNPLNEKIQIGSDDMNYAIWYIAQSIQTMNTQPMKNDLQNIMKSGPSAFSPIRLDCGPGFSYLHYRGIVSFQNNFNIFSLILSSKNETDFVNYIYTANNLRKIGVISNDTYYSGLKYISMQKELNNIDINLSKCKFEDFLHNIEFINDYQIIGIQSMKFDWINLNNQSFIVDSVNYLIDSIIFLKLDENKCDLFIEVINKHALNHPEFIHKIFLLIEVLKNETKLQKKLYEIFSKNIEIFQSQVPKQRLYQLIQNIDDDDLSLQILDFLSPQYFDLNCLEESSIRFILLVKYQSFWLSMFSFLVGTKITDSIESSTPYPVKQQNMIPLMIRLVVYSMQFEISNMVLRNLLVLVNKVQIGHYVDSIRHLCSLGYKNQNPIKYPFRLRNVAYSANTSRRSSIQIDFPSTSSLIQDETEIVNPSSSPLDDEMPTMNDENDNLQDEEDSILIGNNFLNVISKIDYKNVRLQPLSSEYYDETIQYLNDNFKCNDDIKQKDEIYQFLPEFEGIKKIDEIHIEMIADACSQLLIKTSKNFSKFKSNLIKLTIQGADVVKEVAVMVHRAIILKFIQDITYSSIPTKAIDGFGNFLTNRIYEGWWDDHIYDIFQAISPFFTTSNFSKDLFLASIMRCDLISNDEEKKKIISTLMEDSYLYKKAKFFNDLVSKEPFQFTMIEILYRNNLIENLKETILNTFPKNCEFSKSVRDNKFEEFLSGHPIYSSPSNNKHYFEATQRIIKNASDNNKIVIQTRNDLTLPSPLHSIFQYFTSIEKRIEYQYSAFKYQFALRLNNGNKKIEAFIHDLIVDQNRCLRPNSDSIAYSISTAPSPFSVPQKLVPSSYSYNLPCERNKLTLPLPLCTFKTDENKKVLNLKNEDDELLRERIAPSCFTSIDIQCGQNEGQNYYDSSSTVRKKHAIYLPTFSKITNVTKSFKMKYDPTNSGHIFQCRFLSHYESIPCCGLFTRDDVFVILFHADVIKESPTKPFKIELIEKDDREGSSFSSLTTGLAYSSIIDGYCGPWDLFMNHVVLYVPFNEVLSCFPRKHTYLNIGLEIFTLYGCHLSFLFSEKLRKIYLSRVKPLLQLRTVEYYTKKWLNCEMTNFDYLLILNVLGCRSFNDLSQYPVFPWVLSDYKSAELDFDNLSNSQLRKLDRPIGIQTDDRIERFTIVYNETDPPYHYGSHYSHPAAVTHFMFRINPFTDISLHINSGWDNKDRLFWSICESWKSVSESRQTDVKELIPEFFCLSSFLENVNRIKMPVRSDGQTMDCVKLPPWSAKKAFNFIWLNREALESRKVRENLNGWIDLIFGFKQKGPAAIEAINVYQPHCYDTSNTREKSKELNEDDELNSEAETSAMLNFGVCPIQLFFTPHPAYMDHRAAAGSDANDSVAAEGGNESENENNYFESSTIKSNSNIANSEWRLSQLKEFQKFTWMVRYDSNKKEFTTAFKNELFLNFPEKVRIRGNYINYSNSSSTTTSTVSSAASESNPATDLNTNSEANPQMQQMSSVSLTSSIIRFNDIIINSCTSYSTKLSAFALLNGCINVVRKIDTCNDTFSSSSSSTTQSASEGLKPTNNSGFGIDMGLGAKVAANDATNTISTLFCQVSGTLSSNAGYAKPQLLPTICAHGHTIAMAISEKHFILAVATKKNKVILFDITSGRYMRSEDYSDIRPNSDSNEIQNDTLKFIIFDDSVDLLILVSESQIKVVSLTLSYIASMNSINDPVTSIDVTDPLIWNKKPYFVTGHKSGKCCLWEVDVIHNEIRKLWMINCKLSSIVTINIFFKNKAVLVIDENGASVVLSIANMKIPFLNKSLFSNCAVCDQKLEPKKSFICGCCCLAVCSKCYNKKTSYCNSCQSANIKTTDL